MAQVDPDDDTIQRFVVMHYRYDPDRHQRRNVSVAAFDSESEYLARLNELGAALRDRRFGGELHDPRERISGVTLEAGHRTLQRNAHLLRRAIEHGVVPTAVPELALPSNTALISAERPEPKCPNALICHEAVGSRASAP